MWRSGSPNSCWHVRTARAKVAYKEQAAIIAPELKAAEDRAAEAVKGASEGKGARTGKRRRS